jgi:hypothetical protein
MRQGFLIPGGSWRILADPDLFNPSNVEERSQFCTISNAAIAVFLA